MWGFDFIKHQNVFTVYNFSKKNSTEYIRNIFNCESNCFHYPFHKNIVFLKNTCHNMSEDTPECAKLHTLKNSFCVHMLPNHLAMCSKTKRPQIPLKIIPQ